MIPLLLLLVSLETSPPGEARLRFTLDRPASLSGGEITVELDEAVFSAITGFTISGAAGDETAVATIEGRKARIWFASPTAAIGRIAERPILTLYTTTIGAPSLEAAKVTISDPLRCGAGALACTVELRPGTLGEIETSGEPPQSIEAEGFHIQLPKQRQTSGEGGIVRTFVPGGIVVRNPHPFPIEAHFQTTGISREIRAEQTVSLAANQIYFMNGSGIASGYLRVFATAELEMVYLRRAMNVSGAPLSVTTSNMNPIAAKPIQSTVQSTTLDWDWQTGAALPPAQVITVYTVPDIPATQPQFRITTSAPWLTASPVISGRQSILPVSVDPRGLAPGVYRGTVTLTPVATQFFPAGDPVTFAAVLTVRTQPQLKTAVTSMSCGRFGLDTFPASGPSFTTTIQPNPPRHWLTATASPGAVAVACNGDLLTAGNYGGHVVLRGANFTDVIQVTTRIPGGPLIETTGSVRFLTASGAPPPPPRQLPVNSPGPYTTTIQIDTGGNWLTVTSSPNSLTLSVNPTGLSAGAHTALVTLTSPAAAGPTQIPVAIAIYPAPPEPLLANPAFLELRAVTGDPPQFSSIQASSGLRAEPPQWTVETADNNPWLRQEAISERFWSLGVRWDPSKLTPGVYTGRIIARTSIQSVTIPVRLTVVEPPTPAAPYLGVILNAASMRETPIAPTEQMLIHGANITAVAIDGIPLSLASLVVPSQLVGRTEVVLRLYNGTRFADHLIPLAPAAPGVFTTDGSGKGQAIARNSNGTANNPEHPAARNTILWIQATGLNPADVTIQIGDTQTRALNIFPVDSRTPGRDWVEFVIPDNAPSGEQPIILHSSSAQSQNGVTINVE